MFFVSLSNLIIAVMTLRFPSDHEKTIPSHESVLFRSAVDEL